MKNKLYDFRNYGEILLWVLVFLFGYLSTYTKKSIFIQLTAYSLISLGIYLIVTYLYFKKSPILKGISPTSKISIVGTFILSGLLFYAAYWILIHFP